MSKFYPIAVTILLLHILLSTAGCLRRNSDQSPEQFDPPPGVFPEFVGKMTPDKRFIPKCIRDGHVICGSSYVDPAGDPDATRIYYSVDIYDTPDEARARLEELSREKVMDEDIFAWEPIPNKESNLLVRSGFRQLDDGIIGSCSLKHTDGPKLIDVTSSFTCDDARKFLKDLMEK